MATFSLSNAEIVRQVLFTAGLGRDASIMDDATEGDVRAIIRSGLRRFYFPLLDGADQPYQWRFLERHHAISAEDKFEAGTIAIASGVVTKTGGAAWPAGITNYFINVSGHILFVTERTSDSVIEVSHTTLTVAAGTEYTAYKYRYAMPSDFGEWLGGVVYQDGSNTKQLAGSSESEIRLRYAVGQFVENDSTHYVVTPTPDGTQRLYIWPIPAVGAFIQGVYLSVPEDNLPVDLVTPGSTAQASPFYAEAMLEGILAAAEEYNMDAGGVHAQRFERALRAAMSHDRAVGGAYDFSQEVNPNYRGLGRVANEIDFSDAI